MIWLDDDDDDDDCFVGESGLGKSTLVNSLFLTDLYPERHIHTASGTPLCSHYIYISINFPFVNFTECDPIFPALHELKFLHYVAGAPLSLLDY